MIHFVFPKHRQMNLAIVFGAAKKVNYFSNKVAGWDPTKHPRGYKGMFTEVPDDKKIDAKATAAGDVIVTKSGKAFKVEAKSEKGVKVTPLDLETGEPKSGFTVLGPNTTVGVMETAQEVEEAVAKAQLAPGSKHAIGDLPIGTFVQTNKGKQFKVSGHKNWTTVHPIDANGEVAGKHTVLPKDSTVTVIDPKEAEAGHLVATPEVHDAPPTLGETAVVGGPREFYEQLKATIESGGDISALDPRTDNDGDQHSAVRAVIYDLALGKQNGILSSSGKQTAQYVVKTDAAYMEDLEFESFIDVNDKNDLLEESLPETLVVERVIPYTEHKLKITAGRPGAFEDNIPPTFEDIANTILTDEELSFTDQPWRTAARYNKITWDEAAAGLANDLRLFGEGGREKVQAEGNPHGMKKVFDSGNSEHIDKMLNSALGGKLAHEKLAKDHPNRAALVRDLKVEQLYKNEIQKRRAKDGTVAAPPTDEDVVYHMPHWDDIQFEAQTLAGVNQILETTKVTNAEVPAFYNGGVFQDSVLMHQPFRTIGKADMQHDSKVVKKLEALGAKLVENPDAPWVYAGATAQQYPGDALVLDMQNVDGTTIRAKVIDAEDMPNLLQAVMSSALQDLNYKQDDPRLAELGGKLEADIKSVWRGGPDDLSSGYMLSQEASKKMTHTYRDWLGDVQPTNSEYSRSMRAGGVVAPNLLHYQQDADVEIKPGVGAVASAKAKLSERKLSQARIDKLAALFDEEQPYTIQRHVQVRAALSKATSQAFMSEVMGEALGRPLFKLMQDVAEKNNTVPNVPIVDGVRDFSAVKRIEYIPHKQKSWSTGGAITSQRGLFRLVGFTPEEAAAKLQELGVLGDMEPEVPFETVMRSKRRVGYVAPLHPDYMTGKAPLPDAPARITHGITSGSANAANVERILRGGGLKSIAARHQIGILKDTAGVSIGGDMRSGIDHVVFCTENSGGACGGNAGITFVLKPAALLRRDILLAPSDFGGSATRYEDYKRHHNNMEGISAYADNKDKITPYVPLSPAARQKHLTSTNPQGSVEYNMANEIAAEDIEAIGVENATEREKVEQLLQKLYDEGIIVEKPKVLAMNEARLLSKSPLTGKKPEPVAPMEVTDVNGLLDEIFPKG